MDNASYHSKKLENCTPRSDWRKGQILDWLNANEVPFPKDANRTLLWTIARDKASENPRYQIDELIRSCGMEVLRLPPYHCEFNAIEKI